MCPGFGGVAIVVTGHGLGGLVWLFEPYRSPHPQRGMTALAVVEEVVEDRVGQLDAGFPASAVEQFDLLAPQKDSIIVWS